MSVADALGPLVSESESIAEVNDGTGGVAVSVVVIEQMEVWAVPWALVEVVVQVPRMF